jgi:hypothetical protein
MNEENKFSLDVQAETQAISPSIQEDLLNPSEFINLQPSLELPPRILLQATQIDVEENVKAQRSETAALDFNVKMDAEAAYEKAEYLEEQMTEMRGGFQDLYNNVKNNWLPSRQKDEFEERPTTEPTNLIFYARRDRMSMPPHWS